MAPQTFYTPVERGFEAHRRTLRTGRRSVPSGGATAPDYKDLRLHNRFACLDWSARRCHYPARIALATCEEERGPAAR
jgi:hypothetical protein